jgi:hypothetical protein
LEIGWRATSRSRHELIDPTFVNAHPAVYPINLAAVLRGLGQKCRDLIFRRGMVLFGKILAVNGVRVR